MVKSRSYPTFSLSMWGTRHTVYTLYSISYTFRYRHLYKLKVIWHISYSFFLPFDIIMKIFTSNCIVIKYQYTV